MEFPLTEYQERVALATRLMAEHGLDALLITGDYLYSANYRYFTGHVPRDYQANTARPHVLLLSREGAAAISVIYFSETSARESWVQKIHVYAQPFSYSDALTLFQQLDFRSGKVGVELGVDMRMMMPVGEYEKLKAKLPTVEWVDAAPLIWEMRMIKSPAEVECIRRANRINGNALRKTFARVHAGMTEKEMYRTCVLSLVEEGALRPPHTQMTISSGSRKRHQLLTGKYSGPLDIPVDHGDMVFIDCGAVYNGYWGEFGRMAVVGEPSREQLRHYEIVRRIVSEFNSDILRPGITCEQAMKKALRLYERAGVPAARFAKYTNPPYMHLCHGLGMNSSEPPLVRISDQTVIEEGMVLTVEAYLPGPDIVYATEEDVRVTATGCTILSEPDSGLAVIE